MGFFGMKSGLGCQSEGEAADQQKPRWLSLCLLSTLMVVIVLLRHGSRE